VAEEIGVHFATYPFFTMTCGSCLMPVLVKLVKEHDCKSQLMRGIKALNTARDRGYLVDPELVRLGKLGQPVFRDSSKEHKPKEEEEVHVPVPIQEMSDFSCSEGLNMAKKIRLDRRLINQGATTSEKSKTLPCPYLQAQRVYEKPRMCVVCPMRRSRAYAWCYGKLYEEELKELFDRQPDDFDDFVAVEEGRKSFMSMLAQKKKQQSH